MSRLRLQTLRLALVAMAVLVCGSSPALGSSSWHSGGYSYDVAPIGTTPTTNVTDDTAAATRGPATSLGSTSSVGRFVLAAEGGDLAAAARARAEELQNSLPEGSQSRVTMAVGKGLDADGNVQTIVGTSEPGGYLRPGVTLNPGEVMAPGAGHAEVSIIEAGGPFSDPFYIAAARPICPFCAAAIEDAGATPASPLK